MPVFGLVNTITWDQPDDASTEPITYHTVKCGPTQGGPYSITKDTLPASGIHTMALKDLPWPTTIGPAQFWCRVSAHNILSESPNSLDEVTFRMPRLGPPPAPTNLKIGVQ